MYNEEYFYGLTDLIHFNVYASLLKNHIKKEERVIIKVFKKDNEVVVIETNSDLMSFDLVFLKTLERYYSDYEIPGMIYEYIEGIGSWYRVLIPEYNVNDKYLKPFFMKKKIRREDLIKYAKSEEELTKLNKFYDITKGLVRFTEPKDVKKLFLKIEE